jgi:hypothetical protein
MFGEALPVNAAISLTPSLGCPLSRHDSLQHQNRK